MIGFSKSVTDLACSLDDEYVAASSIDGHKIHLYRTKTSNRLTSYHGHTDTINSVKFNFNKKTVISGSRDHTIRHWDMMTGKPL